jgi:hypothetical protein
MREQSKNKSDWIAAACAKKAGSFRPFLFASGEACQLLRAALAVAFAAALLCWLVGDAGVVGAIGADGSTL